MAYAQSPRWNPHIRRRYEVRKCLFCYKDFGTWLSENKKFCSYKCSNTFTSKMNPRWNKGKKKGQQGITSGEKHWNWKGGISSSARVDRVRFLKYLRPKILARDNYTCQICDQYSGNLQVDHIKSWSEYPDLRFNELNCRTLCMACHYYITFKKKIPSGIVWGHNLSERTKI